MNKQIKEIIAAIWLLIFAYLGWFLYAEGLVPPDIILLVGCIVLIIVAGLMDKWGI